MRPDVKTALLSIGVGAALGLLLLLSDHLRVYLFGGVQ